MESVVINKSAFEDLSNLIEELQLWKETLEIESDPELMESLRSSEEQIKNRDFGNWDDL